MSSSYLMKNMTNPPRPGQPAAAVPFSDDAMEAKLTATASSHLEGMRTCNSLSKGQRRREWINLFAHSKASKKAPPPRPVDRPPPREHSAWREQEESPPVVEEEESSPEAAESPPPVVEEEEESPESPPAESPAASSPEPEERVVELQEPRGGGRKRRKAPKKKPEAPPEQPPTEAPPPEEEEEGVRRVELDQGDPRLASGFSMLSVKQLRERCAQQGLSHAKLKKQELVELLQRHADGA